MNNPENDDVIKGLENLVVKPSNNTGTFRTAQPSAQNSPKFPSLRGQMGTTTGTSSAPDSPALRNQPATPTTLRNQPATPTTLRSQPATPTLKSSPSVSLIIPQKQLGVGLYNYEAIDSTTVSFKKGEQVVILDKEYDEWWRIELNGQVGLAPANYIKEIETTAKPNPRASRAYNKRKSINVQRASTIYAALTESTPDSTADTDQ